MSGNSVATRTCHRYNHALQGNADDALSKGSTPTAHAHTALAMHRHGHDATGTSLTDWERIWLEDPP
jgi:hypothetical protein